MDESGEENASFAEENQTGVTVSITKSSDSSDQNLNPSSSRSSKNEKEKSPPLATPSNDSLLVDPPDINTKDETSDSKSGCSNPSANSSSLSKLNNEKKAAKSAPRYSRDKIINRRKRPLNEEDDNFEYGSPYVVLALNQSNPITCYMMPKEGEPQNNQYVATIPIAPTISLNNGNSLIVSNNPSNGTPKKLEVVQNVQSQSSTPMLSELEPQKKKKVKTVNFTEGASNCSKIDTIETPMKLSPEKDVTKSSILVKSIAANNTILLGAQPTPNSIILPSLNSDANKIQIMITPGITSDGNIPQIVSKVPSPVISKGKVFPVRHVLPKTTEGVVDSTQAEIQKVLEEQVKSLKKELAKSRDEINEEKRNSALVKSLREKLLNKRKQIKTMCTQRKRLIKRLDNCREELEKTRKALELVESQAILWNNANMSDLGKLIFGLHTVKNKRFLDSKLAASRAPPEVKGFVISLYMTSPKAYQLVRDCFNGLPHPKTVSRWLHGDRIEESKAQLSKHTQLNDVTIEETFSRVLDQEEELEEQGGEMELLGNEVTITEKFIDGTEMTESSTDIYYILDEKGNVAGQLTGVSADMFLSADDLDPKLLPQHEVIINE